MNKENNLSTENFRPTCEYMAFVALQEAGLLPKNKAASIWNNENSKMHKFWKIFIKLLDDNGYKIRFKNK